jgi:hypothetical protein
MTKSILAWAIAIDGQLTSWASLDKKDCEAMIKSGLVGDEHEVVRVKISIYKPKEK